jgi:hypothetical protein
MSIHINKFNPFSKIKLGLKLASVNKRFWSIMKLKRYKPKQRMSQASVKDCFNSKPQQKLIKIKS